MSLTCNYDDFGGIVMTRLANRTTLGQSGVLTLTLNCVI